MKTCHLGFVCGANPGIVPNQIEIIGILLVSPFQRCFNSQLSQQDEKVLWKFLCSNNPLPPELYREPFFGTKKSKTNSKKHFATVTLSELRFLIDVSSLSVSAVSDSRFAAVLFKIDFKRFPILEQPLVAWAMGIPKDSGIAFTSFEKNWSPSVTHCDTFKLWFCSKTVHRISWVSALAKRMGRQSFRQSLQNFAVGNVAFCQSFFVQFFPMVIIWINKNCNLKIEGGK